MAPVYPQSPANAAELLDVRAVAALLGCSTRHVKRLADAGKLPSPLKLGRLKRWPRRAIRQWLDDGCPRVRTVRAGGVA
jgi:excisionase family DNA binding protein